MQVIQIACIKYYTPMYTVQPHIDSQKNILHVYRFRYDSTSVCRVLLHERRSVINLSKPDSVLESTYTVVHMLLLL